MSLKKVFVACSLFVMVAGVALAGPPPQSARVSISVDNAVDVTQLAKLEGHTGPIFSLAFSPDGSTLATASIDNSARLWAMEDFSEKAVLEGHTAQVVAVAFNADGSEVWTAGYDYTIRRWNAESGELLETQDKAADDDFIIPDISNLLVRFSPDATRLVWGADFSALIYVWDTTTRTRRDFQHTITEYPGRMVFNADGTHLAVVEYGNLVHIYDFETGEELQVLTGPSDIYYLDQGLAWSADGTRLAVVDVDNASIHLFDVETGEWLYELIGHAPNLDGTLGIYDLAFSPDGSVLASTSYDNSLRLWDVAKGSEIVALASGGGASVAFTADGALMATGNLDGSVELWGIVGD